jgi:transposase
MSGTFWLSEEQFNKIKSLLPDKPRGVPRVDDRMVLSGIIFCLQRGSRWSDVPAEYGPAETLYNRYKRWSEAGVFERAFGTLAQEMADFQTLMIDATYVKTHRIAANGVKETPATGVQSG